MLFHDLQNFPRNDTAKDAAWKAEYNPGIFGNILGKDRCACNSLGGKKRNRAFIKDYCEKQTCLQGKVRRDNTKKENNSKGKAQTGLPPVAL